MQRKIKNYYWTSLLCNRGGRNGRHRYVGKLDIWVTFNLVFLGLSLISRASFALTHAVVSIVRYDKKYFVKKGDCTAPRCEMTSGNNLIHANEDWFWFWFHEMMTKAPHKHFFLINLFLASKIRPINTRRDRKLDWHTLSLCFSHSRYFVDRKQREIEK